MAGVAKWLRHRVVVSVFGGSSPLVCPILPFPLVAQGFREPEIQADTCVPFWFLSGRKHTRHQAHVLTGGALDEPGIVAEQNFHAAVPEHLRDPGRACTTLKRQRCESMPELIRGAMLESSGFQCTRLNAI